jgi:hypothetical protein
MTSTAPNKTPLITGAGLLQVQTYDLPGDFDNNQIVDAADLTVWRNAVVANSAAGDTNGDGRSNGADFLIWQRYLGATNPAVAASAAVPEPSTIVGAMIAMLGLASRARRRN